MRVKSCSLEHLVICFTNNLCKLLYSIISLAKVMKHLLIFGVVALVAIAGLVFSNNSATIQGEYYTPVTYGSGDMLLTGQTFCCFKCTGSQEGTYCSYSRQDTINALEQKESINPGKQCEPMYCGPPARPPVTFQWIPQSKFEIEY